MTRSHEWIDRRSLALDQAIANKLEANPKLLKRANETLNHWIEQRKPDVPPVLSEWEQILKGASREEIISLLRADDERARRLRQSSPFCGILMPEERMAILKDYETRRA